MPHDGEPAPCESAASSRFATSGCSPDTSLSVLYGTSPGSLGSGSHPYLLGTSPPSSGHGEGKRLPAKKFWSRILYDPSLEAFEFKVPTPPRHNMTHLWNRCRDDFQCWESLGCWVFKPRLPWVALGWVHRDGENGAEEEWKGGVERAAA
jgi:hypothetical protein